MSIKCLVNSILYYMKSVAPSLFIIRKTISPSLTVVIGTSARYNMRSLASMKLFSRGLQEISVLHQS